MAEEGNQALVTARNGTREWLRVANDGTLTIDWPIAEFLVQQLKLGLASADPAQSGLAVVAIAVREHVLRTQVKSWKP